MKLDGGQVVGELVLRRKLADGGMGSLWVAYHAKLSREVAVKFLSRCQPVNPQAARRFSLEASIVARLRSPHIPQVFEHGLTEDGTPYLVMELLDGIDLTTWLERRGRLTLAQAAKLLDHVGLALGAAHALGVIHRDVTPRNILVSTHADEFHAYLIDFGIAKAIDPSGRENVTQPGTTIGTPRYMSPEQLTGAGNIDHRADIWSLGVVVYLCLTGALPFSGETFRDLCMATYCGEFRPVTSHRPDLPHALDGWFDRALSSDLSGRFTSIGEMRADFAEATRGAPFEYARAGVRVASSASLRATVPSVVVTNVSSRRSTGRGAIGRRATAICAVGGGLLGAVAAFFITSTGPGASLTVARPPRAAAASERPPSTSRPDGGPDAGAETSRRSADDVVQASAPLGL